MRLGLLEQVYFISLCNRIMKIEFKKSLIVYFPTALVLTSIFYSIDDKLNKSIIFSLIGAAIIFFVPLIFKGLKDNGS